MRLQSLPPPSSCQNLQQMDQAFTRLKEKVSRVWHSRKSSKPSAKLSVEESIRLRAKCGHFRVLVIGRANAGKTTLLKRVCDTIEDPEIYDPDGNKIDPKVIEASESRGEHEIENQLIFKSNQGFIFHDSRGFESGSAEETEKMKNFILERGKTNTLADQLHAIWYCLPTNTNRPLLGAEKDFFNTFARGTVPVVVVFTKFDGLIDEKFAKLVNDGCPYEQAEEMAHLRATEHLGTDFKEPLQQFKFHPSDYVQMNDMREAITDCSELIAKTANVLNDRTLQMMLVSVQQNNINLSIEYAVRYSMDETTITDIIKF
ncbi:GTP-binding protein [Mycena metata]|uniref:GTP-binding protein n=1 Tax=Mycena metata TaxID=1033252 RepID=A0AAD7H978_9AGAR|nr:GTP-binding protein [Mycena metata]